MQSEPMAESLRKLKKLKVIKRKLKSVDKKFRLMILKPVML